MDIKALNQQLEADNQELESMIWELVERGELACTGQVCGAQVEGV